MTPIAISNARPGFIPLSPRPLSIVGMSRMRPAYKPAPYRPPLLSDPASLSQVGPLPFDSSRISESLLFGVGGVAAVAISGVIPSPLKELSIVAGIGLIGYGVFNLFEKKDESKILPEEVPPEVRIPSSGVRPVAPPGQLAQMLTLAMDQNQSQYGGTTRQMFSSQEYEFNILNKTQNTLSFYVGAEVRDTPDQKILYRSSPDDPGVAGRKMVSVAGKKQIRGTVYVPALAPNTIFWPQSVTVQVTIFQSLRDAEPAILSAPITIKYAWAG